MAHPPTPFRTKARHWLTDWVLRLLIWGLLRLPYPRRVAACGWVMSRVLAPMAGYSERIRTNLRIVMPDMPAHEVAQLVRDVPDNIGRSIIEIYSGEEFMRRAAHNPPHGPGWEVLEAEKDAGRPIFLVTAHIGNYDALRAALVARGYDIGFLYKEMSNPYFQAHYLKAITSISAPGFDSGRKGVKGMVSWIKGGNILGILNDQHGPGGAELTFFGKRALTPLSVAELALKYNALVIPAYGLRNADGLSFDIRIEAPIPHGTPEEMCQALNDNLEAVTRQHMGQWFWIHRRWKALERQMAKG